MLVGIIPTLGGDVASATINHGGLVGTTPRLDLAEFRDGQVLAGDQVGRYLVLGGDFSPIRTPDGTLVNQPYLAAIGIDTALSFDFAVASPMIHAAEIVPNSTRLAVVHQGTVTLNGDNTGVGSYQYVIRSRQAATPTDTVCSPDPTIVA